MGQDIWLNGYGGDVSYASYVSYFLPENGATEQRISGYTRPQPGALIDASQGNSRRISCRHWRSIQWPSILGSIWPRIAGDFLSVLLEWAAIRQSWSTRLIRSGDAPILAS